MAAARKQGVLNKIADHSNRGRPGSREAYFYFPIHCCVRNGDMVAVVRHTTSTGAKSMHARSIGKLITYIARHLNRYVDRETAHLRLSSATVPFLTYLYEHNGVHQDEMAENLQFDKSSAARAVKVLEQRGYVTKVIDSNNKRRNVVTLTNRGFSIQDELAEILEQTTNRLFADFRASEIDRYFKTTQKINQNLRKMMNDQKR